MKAQLERRDQINTIENALRKIEEEKEDNFKHEKNNKN